MDEFERYVEHLQRQTRTPWAEEVLARTLARLKVDGERRVRIAADVGLAEEASEYLRVLLSGEPVSPSEFESPLARRIFERLLEEILSAAANLGVAVENEVFFANSPDAHPTSYSVPSSHKHIVLAGAGTYAFCNYWAKVVAQTAAAYYDLFGGVRMTRKGLRQLWVARVDLIATALRLAVYCRLIGSVIGFGRMSAVPAQTGFRVELLTAMETFAIAHEVGHCYIEEREPGKTITAEDELTCDAYGLAVGRAVGMARDNFSMLSGAGAYTFLRAVAVSFEASNITSATSHPHPASRAAAVLAQSTASLSRRRAAEIRRYFREIDALFAEVERHCEMVLPRS